MPSFAALEARRRTRDRRRMALGASTLAITAVVAGALVVPALNGGGGDQLTPARPAADSFRTVFGVQYTSGSPSEGRSDGVDSALARCLELPGAHDEVGIKLSDPPLWVVTVEGTHEETAAVRDCLADLDSAEVQTISTDEAESSKD